MFESPLFFRGGKTLIQWMVLYMQCISNKQNWPQRKKWTKTHHLCVKQEFRHGFKINMVLNPLTEKEERRVVYKVEDSASAQTHEVNQIMEKYYNMFSGERGRKLFHAIRTVFAGNIFHGCKF